MLLINKLAPPSPAIALPIINVLEFDAALQITPLNLEDKYRYQEGPFEVVVLVDLARRGLRSFEGYEIGSGISRYVVEAMEFVCDFRNGGTNDSLENVLCWWCSLRRRYRSRDYSLSPTLSGKRRQQKLLPGAPVSHHEDIGRHSCAEQASLPLHCRYRWICSYWHHSQPGGLNGPVSSTAAVTFSSRTSILCRVTDDGDCW